MCHLFLYAHYCYYNIRIKPAMNIDFLKISCSSWSENKKYSWEDVLLGLLFSIRPITVHPVELRKLFTKDTEVPSYRRGFLYHPIKPKKNLSSWFVELLMFFSFQSPWKGWKLTFLFCFVCVCARTHARYTGNPLIPLIWQTLFFF